MIARESAFFSPNSELNVDSCTQGRSPCEIIHRKMHYQIDSNPPNAPEKTEEKKSQQ